MALGIRRREFIALLGGTASVVAAPQSARSQTPPKPLRIGMVSGESQGRTAELRRIHRPAARAGLR